MKGSERVNSPKVILLVGVGIELTYLGQGREVLGTGRSQKRPGMVSQENKECGDRGAGVCL